MEIIIFLYPSFSASAILFSILLIALISPERPISPAKQVRESIGTSWSEDNIEQTIAKSIAVSSTFMPPVIFKNTSFAPNLNPHLFLKQPIAYSFV